MWPSPTCQDGKNNAGPSQWGRHSYALNVAVQFPTPTAKDADGPWRTTHSPSLNAMLFPTPRVNSLCGSSGAWNAIQNNPALTADEKRAMTSSAGRGAIYDTPGSAMFNFGRNYGFLLGVLAALEIRTVLVTPQAWQKALGLGHKGDDKAAWKRKLKAEAGRLYPGLKPTLKTADALLILEYARRETR